MLAAACAVVRKGESKELQPASLDLHENLDVTRDRFIEMLENKMKKRAVDIVHDYKEVVNGGGAAGEVPAGTEVHDCVTMTTGSPVFFEAWAIWVSNSVCHYGSRGCVTLAQ